MPDLMTSVDSAPAISESENTKPLFPLFALFCTLLSLAGVFGREFYCSFDLILISVLS